MKPTFSDLPMHKGNKCQVGGFTRLNKWLTPPTSTKYTISQKIC